MYAKEPMLRLSKGNAASLSVHLPGTDPPTMSRGYAVKDVLETLYDLQRSLP